MAQVDYFLKIEGIEGESQQKGHEKEIQIDSFSFGLTNSAGGAFGGGGGAGKAQFQDFHFTAKVSKASPIEFLKAATGAHMPTATMSARKAGEVPQDFLKIKLSDVLISGYSLSGSGDIPEESGSLAFAKIEFMFSPQGADGKLLPAVQVGFDLKQNKAV